MLLCLCRFEISFTNLANHGRLPNNDFKIQNMTVLKLSILFLSLLLALNSTSQIAVQAKDYTGRVDPFIGTGADGNTFPGASYPFGGVQLSPDTQLNACGGYAYSDSTIIGFSHTHLNGVGEPEYRDVLFMPTTGEVHLNAGTAGMKGSGYRSAFDHQNETALPGYYSVLLKDYNIQVELTTTLRAGFHKYTFPKSNDSHIIIDLAHPNGAEFLNIKKISNTEIEGLRRSHGWAWDQYVYFVAKFSKPFISADLAINDTIKNGITEATGKNIKAVLNFQTSDNEAILVKVGISAVSTDGARKNLASEIPNWDFEAVKKETQNVWNKQLSKIEVEGGTPEQQTIFYTSMYHAALSPNIFMDIDGKYRGTDHKVHVNKDFTTYTVFSLWDTYRALHPLFTIIDQKRTNDFIKTLLQIYDDGGRLPMWPLAGNYTDDMLGYHAVPVIVDAYMKGIRGYDIEKAFKAIKHSAELDKLGLKYYKKIGSLPYDRQGESVSKTLEYCYDDWCISLMAKAMNRKPDYLNYNQRAHYWENVFDPSVGFMSGKSFDRKWQAPFDPLVNSAYSEGNAYQYMYVPHDVTGLSTKMGGDLKFSKWLDVLFSLSSGNSNRGMIGQYWHGNEPSHHLAYLYDYVGEPWKTQKLVDQILNELYSTANDGLAGNDDCGQISAWYILSSMGFYPVAPGQTIYAISTPLFNKAVIRLESGKAFTIKATNRSEKNIYIQSAILNGKPYNKSYLTHKDIMDGSTFVFEMGDVPNPKWGSDQQDRPYSENGEAVTSLPYVKSGETLFDLSTKVSLGCDTKDSEIRYTLDNSEPTSNSLLYENPILIDRSCTLKMKSISKTAIPSIIINIDFKKAVPIQFLTKIKVKQGLAFDYFEKFFVTTADLDIVDPIASGITTNFGLNERKRESYFGLRFDGYVKVPKDGIYTFYLKSNDGSRLFIDGSELIENDANHGAVEEPGNIALKAGFHKIRVKYFNCGGGKALNVSWSGPAMEKHEIQAIELYIEEK